MEGGGLVLARAVGVLPRDKELRRALQIDADEEFFTVAPASLSKLPPQDYQSFCGSSPFADGLPGGVKIVPVGLSSKLPGLQSLAATLSCYLGGLDVVVQDVRGGDVRSMRLFRRVGDRVFAADLLDTLTRQLPAASSVVIGVTAEPMVGLDGCSHARLAEVDGGHTAVLSIHAFGPAETTLSAHPSTGLVLTTIQTCLHLLGFSACGFASCVMNPWDGTDQLPPLPLCPVCLRKLSLVVGVGATLRAGNSAAAGQRFDVVARYMHLAARCRELGIEEYVRWYEERIMAITQTTWAVPGEDGPVCALERPTGGVESHTRGSAHSREAIGTSGRGLSRKPVASSTGGGDAKTAQLRLLKSRRRVPGRGFEDGHSRYGGGVVGESRSDS